MRFARRPVVRRLRGGVDDKAMSLPSCLKEVFHGRRSRGYEIVVFDNWECGDELLAVGQRGGFLPKNHWRRSLSMPTTLNPSRAKRLTLSEPINRQNP